MTFLKKSLVLGLLLGSAALHLTGIVKDEFWGTGYERYRR